jgi:hypothetical protein
MRMVTTESCQILDRDAPSINEDFANNHLALNMRVSSGGYVELPTDLKQHRSLHFSIFWANASQC